MAWTDLQTDYQDASYEGQRKYQMIENEDGTVSFNDVTEYDNLEKAFYKAADVNKAFGAINGLMNKEEAAVDTGICQGRLSLSETNPVPSTDITRGDTLYFLPYKGKFITLYDGGAWKTVAFSGLSVSLSGMSNETPYDVFAQLNNDVPELVLSSWGSVNERSYSLTWQDGVLVKGSDPTMRYLGTIAKNSDGYGEDSLTGRLLWNYYNRVSRPIYAKLLTTRSQGTSHLNSWAPYYDDDAPTIRLLVPTADAEFSLNGVGISSPISESDRGYQRASAVGIGQDMETESPYTGNTSCVPAFTHSFGNGPMIVTIYNKDSSFIGYHLYTLAFWSNYSFYPAGTNLANISGGYPGLYGQILG